MERREDDDLPPRDKESEEQRPSDLFQFTQT